MFPKTAIFLGRNNCFQSAFREHQTWKVGTLQIASSKVCYHTLYTKL